MCLEVMPKQKTILTTLTEFSSSTIYLEPFLPNKNHTKESVTNKIEQQSQHSYFRREQYK